MEHAPEDNRRHHYVHQMTIPTRWIDNDIYAHVNNATYYTFFDTIINHYLLEEGDLDPINGASVGFAVETFCRFLAPIAFPDILDVRLRVGRLGNSSVRYELAIFKENSETPAAVGHFVHVFVNRQTERPTPIEGKLRDALARLIPAD